MVKVHGIGAVMIFAREAEKLSHWYAEHLGVITELDETDGNFYGTIDDANQACVVRFGIYPAAQSIEPTSSSVMINFKVVSLDQFKAHLTLKRVSIEAEMETHGSRFLYLRDPEGNRIELWETGTFQAVETANQTSNLEEDRTNRVG